jgi:hypothetical protein
MSKEQYRTRIEDAVNKMNNEKVLSIPDECVHFLVTCELITKIPILDADPRSTFEKIRKFLEVLV